MSEFTKDPSTHPAHAPLTKERLTRVRDELQRTLEYSEGSNLNYVVADAVKAIDEVLKRRKAEREAMPMFYVEGDAAKRLIKGQTRFATITTEPKKGATLPLYIQPQAAPVVPEDSSCKFCGGSGYFRWQQSSNMCPCPCLGWTENANGGE